METRYYGFLFTDVILLSNVSADRRKWPPTNLINRQLFCLCPNQVNDGVYFVEEEPIVMADVVRILTADADQSNNLFPIILLCPLLTIHSIVMERDSRLAMLH